jgi:hypothetical protein
MAPLRYASTMLIDRLVGSAVDVVGDVHGELQVLEKLIERLGYDAQGRHPDGRSLVFVGDLVDRGRESLEVVRRVRGLVDGGRSQCVLGNHELNILREEKKDGNDWYFDETSEDEKDEVRAFFARLPLALEGEDLRIVHACWDEAHVNQLRGRKESVVELSERLASEVERRLAEEGILEQARREADHPLDDRSREPPMLPAIAALAVRRQVEHPIKVLTSGLETVADAPFWAGGKWRLEQRVTWWDSYDGPMVIVGHYWRSKEPGGHNGKGPDLFAGTDPHAPLGPAGKVMCIDYSIGHRQAERDKEKPFESALAAYRWPDRELAFAPE